MRAALCHVDAQAKVPSDDSGETPDICVIELGGTVGDIENMCARSRSPHSPPPQACAAGGARPLVLFARAAA